MPLIREVQAAGFSVSQLEQLLINRYKKYLIAPQISLEITKYRRITVHLLGEVRRPGVAELMPRDTLLDAIMQAGGITSQGNVAKISIFRNNILWRTIDVGKMLRGEDLADNVILNEGDQVLVPQGNSRILVTGQVVKPGSYDYLSGETFFEAVLRAGGITENADRKTARLIRNSPEQKEISISIEQLLSGNRSNDIALIPGDLIVVMETSAKVTVLGEVHKIGVYPLKEKETVLELITKAGGLTEKANKRKISILRRQGETVTMLNAPLDNVSKKTLELNPELLTGDVIFIPTAKKPFKITDILTSLLFFTKEITVK